MIDYIPVAEGWPTDTVPIDQARLMEMIGWDVLTAMSDQGFAVERDRDNRPVGVRVRLSDDWWVVALGTADGWSIGRYRAMVPFGWMTGVASADLAEVMQRAAVVGYPWPPDDEAFDE